LKERDRIQALLLVRVVCYVRSSHTAATVCKIVAIERRMILIYGVSNA